MAPLNCNNHAWTTQHYYRASNTRDDLLINPMLIQLCMHASLYLRVVCAEGGNDVPGLLPRPDDGEPAGEGPRRGDAALAGAAAAAHEAGRERAAVLGDL
jgi:hypothetical protein